MAITNETLESYINKNCLDLTVRQELGPEEIDIITMRQELDSEDIKIICDFLKSYPEISALYLYENQIGDEGAKALAANTTLTTLVLGRSCIGDEGAKALAANTTLRAIELTGNHIGDEGAKALAANTTLTSLNLSRNHIGDEGAKALAANTTLCAIELTGNRIGDEGAKALAASKSPLRTIEMTGNHIGDEGAKAVTANATVNSFDDVTTEKLSCEEKATLLDASKKDISTKADINIGMSVLSGFIAVLGVAAVAVAFAALNAATFGVAGLVVVSVGATMAVGGLGFFAHSMSKNSSDKNDDESYAPIVG